MLPRKAKGRRPTYADDPTVDKLLAMVMALAAEVSTLRERLDTIERLCSAKGFFTTGEIESFTLDEKAKQERDAMRAAFLDRILRIVSEELEAEARGESLEEAKRTVREIAGSR
jgi:hypothetical protein